MAQAIATEYDLDKKSINRTLLSLVLVSCSGDRHQKLSAEKMLND